MADIQPNAQGKVRQARRRLKQHLAALKTADQLTAGDYRTLSNQVLIDLVRLGLYSLNELGDND